MGINAPIMVWPELLHQIREELVYREPLGCQQLKQHQAGRDAVAFGDMAREPDAAALFRPQQHPAFDHFRGDVLEPNARLNEFKSIGLAHFVHHGRGGQRFHDPSPALPVDDEMMQQQANKLVGGEIIAVAIHAAHAVCVAVRHQADIMRVFLKKCGAAPVVLLHRFRVNAAEHHVVLAVQRRHSASRARQQFLEAARTHAEQRLVGKPQLGFGDELEVHEPFQGGVVGGPDILDSDLFRLDTVSHGLGPDRVLIQELLHRLAGR